MKKEMSALVQTVDLECTGDDDHVEPLCPKCERIRVRIAELLAELLAKLQETP